MISNPSLDIVILAWPIEYKLETISYLHSLCRNSLLTVMVHHKNSNEKGTKIKILQSHFVLTLFSILCRCLHLNKKKKELEILNLKNIYFFIMFVQTLCKHLNICVRGLALALKVFYECNTWILWTRSTQIRKMWLGLFNVCSKWAQHLSK